MQIMRVIRVLSAASVTDYDGYIAAHLPAATPVDKTLQTLENADCYQIHDVSQDETVNASYKHFSSALTDRSGQII